MPEDIHVALNDSVRSTTIAIQEPLLSVEKKKEGGPIMEEKSQEEIDKDERAELLNSMMTDYDREKIKIGYTD